MREGTLMDEQQLRNLVARWAAHDPLSGATTPPTYAQHEAELAEATPGEEPKDA